ncbi:hypothetical protein [Candidatus Binatus sp.]|uniref:hypothetical protein n=1 Tax=Candidatus Binatus sp. TaxID=2811406 RepID=UPI003BAE3495
MLETVPFEKVVNLDLIPQAILNKPVSYFSEHWSIPFAHKYDQLDSYDQAALSLNGVLFVLRHYQHYPAGTTTICLPREISELNQITKQIYQIVEALHLSSAVIRWQRADNPDL